jgi:hypothetical protein
VHLANEVLGINRPDLMWIADAPEGTPPGDRVVAMSEIVAELVAAAARGTAPEPTVPPTVTP